MKVKDIQGTGKRLGNSTDKHGTFSIRSRRDYQLRLKIPLRSTHNLVLMVSRGTGRGACMCICLSLTKLICTASLSILSKREEKIAKRFCVNFAPFIVPFSLLPLLQCQWVCGKFKVNLLNLASYTCGFIKTYHIGYNRNS